MNHTINHTVNHRRPTVVLPRRLRNEQCERPYQCARMGGASEARLACDGDRAAEGGGERVRFIYGL